MSVSALWGIDLGGTKIEGIVIQPKPGQSPKILCRQRIASKANKGYEYALRRIHTLINTLSDQVGSTPKIIGIGTPGTIDRATGLLRGSNTVHLNGKPLGKDLEKLLSVPIIVQNDANCFALAEARMGIVQDIAPDAKVVFGVIMGTGVGGGMVVDNVLISGKHAIAGEWGHNFLHRSGGECYCGKIGCVETVISGPGLEKFYAQKSTQNRSLEEIVELAKKKDPYAIATINRLIKYFGIGVASIINMIDPDVIIIGGGLGNIDSLYTDGVREIRKWIFASELNTKIVKPKLGDSAGVFGAAFLTE